MHFVDETIKTIIMSSPTPWATLTPFGEAGSKEIPLFDETFVVGRSKTCDHLLPGKKMISGRHFVVRRAATGSAAELEDCSTNGTMLNSTQIVRSARAALNDGDTISVVFGKAAQGMKSVGFIFHLVSSEDTSAPDADDDLDETQKFDDEFISPESDVPGTSKRPSDLEDQRANKRIKTEETDQDDMGENMMCCICQDMLHDCVSVQPCMHCFCGGCYSDWMKRSKLCPQCRKKVLHVAKNHTVNNLVNAYLKLHPEKKRDVEELSELDAKNTLKEGLKGDKLTALNLLRSEGNSQHSLDEEESYIESDDDDDDEESPAFIPPIVNPRPTCVQCPVVNPSATSTGGRTTRTALAAAASAASAAASVSSDSADAASGPSSSTSVGPTSSGVNPPPPIYECTVFQLHINCRCCTRMMPDRRFQSEDPDFPLERRQICALCANVYCHAYLGCNCVRGCLMPLKNISFGDAFMRTILLDNEYESKVLTDWLAAESKSKEDMFRECVAELDAGRFSLPSSLLLVATIQFPGKSSLGALKGEDLVCRDCAERVFKELAFFFRESIPRDRLPADVTRRTNCWWGRNCRTAKTKNAHAEKLNHICQQTRNN